MNASDLYARNVSITFISFSLLGTFITCLRDLSTACYIGYYV